MIVVQMHYNIINCINILQKKMIAKGVNIVLKDTQITKNDCKSGIDTRLHGNLQHSNSNLDHAMCVCIGHN